MAERQQPHQLQVHPQQRYTGGGIKTLMPQQDPSATKVPAILAGVPVGGTLLTLAGLTLAGSVIGLMITTPIFILFSPFIVPAAIVVGLALAGFLTSGALGLTGLSSLTYLMNRLRSVTAGTEDVDHYAKRRAHAGVGRVRGAEDEGGWTEDRKQGA